MGSRIFFGLRALALFCFFSIFALASDFDIKEDFSTVYLSPYFEYKQESPQTTFLDVIQKRFSPEKSTNFGYKKIAVWSKVTLKNNTSKHIKLYLTNLRVGMDELDVYTVSQSGKTQHYVLGDTRSQLLRPFASRDSSCSVVLGNNESTTIFIRHANSYGPTDTSWVLKSESSFIGERLFDVLYWGIFIGIISALIIYNLSIYFAIKKIEFLFYVAVAFSTLIFQMHGNGIIYALDVGIPLNILNQMGAASGAIAVLFVVLFNYYFLNIKTNFPYLQKFYKAMLIISAFMIVDVLFVGIDMDYRKLAVTLNIIIGTTVTIILLIVGAIAVTKKIIGSMYYLIGQGIMLIAHTYYIISNLNETVGTTEFLYKIPTLGTLADMIFLALALNVRIKNDNILSRRNENLIFFLSRFDATGVVLNNIIHQWKLPLARIGTLVTEIEALVHLNRPIEQKIKDGLPQISYNLELMKHTVKEFYEFYKNDDKKTLFYPKKEIDSIVSILGDEIKELDMSIKISIPTDISINTFRHAFVHIFLILLHNSAKIAKTRKIQKPSIVISLQSDKTGIIFYVQDNCGGIESNVYGKLFDLFVSTNKDQKTPNGSGLVIAKMLTEERLGGSLSASNGPNGAIFTVKIP